MLFILHADHEQNCSTNVMRSVGSSDADPYLCTAAAAAALSGPLHGAANVQVWRMLREIGSKQHVPAYIRRVKAGEVRLLGVGHRVYENYDPRARIIKQVAQQIRELTGKNLLLDTALELERIVLADDYFISRKLYPKVEFYSGIVYQALGFPEEMFPVLFAIARTSGWLAQWEEMLQDPDHRMARPRQLYIGPDKREVLPIESRMEE
jgi:citrate synthase